jgi:hypothetical protein
MTRYLQFEKNCFPFTIHQSGPCYTLNGLGSHSDFQDKIFEKKDCAFQVTQIITTTVEALNVTEAFAKVDAWSAGHLEAFIGWVLEHPYQTALHSFNAVLFILPNPIVNIFMNILGMTVAGPAGHACMSQILVNSACKLIDHSVSLFRVVMSWFGVVPAGRWYAILQSAYMGGYSVSIVAFWARAWAAIPSVLA